MKYTYKIKDLLKSNINIYIYIYKHIYNYYFSVIFLIQKRKKKDLYCMFGVMTIIYYNFLP